MEYQFSKEELGLFARGFLDLVKEARVFAFHGQMGAGKTTIITAICHELGVKDVMSSPTFSIINEYGYNSDHTEQRVYHIDLYRLKDEREVIDAGVEDCLYSGSVCMVEWPEKAPHLFDNSVVHVHIEPLSENERRVIVNLPSPL